MATSKWGAHHYKIICPDCHSYITSGYALRCACGDALLRSIYKTKRLTIGNDESIWRFAEWLPTQHRLKTRGRAITYESTELARELGLDNLFIGFSGFWPEKGATLETCSFKELESPPTVQRALENGVKTLVVSSVGNTARAFAHTVSTSTSDIKLLLVGLESSFGKFWLPEPPSDNVKVILLKSGNDYADAIALGNRLGSLPGIVNEGGARNVARRDGMGTVMLDAALTIGRAPDHYFQAVGSGTGGIAAWEAALRLKDDGRFVKDDLPMLHLAQNVPFVPMYNAWQARRRFIDPAIDMPDARSSIKNLYADVLSNRTPAYSIKGGVYDALVSTSGEMYAIATPAAKEAARLFEDLEGIDIVPAAAVATAALLQAVDKGAVSKNDITLLNVTGGGLCRLKQDKTCVKMKPDLLIERPDSDLSPVFELVR
ncbi:MAG: cysteate synthase [Halobacteriota archaeon]